MTQTAKSWREQARKLKQDVVAIALAMRDPPFFK
jgi:hypothetical protein